MRTTVDRGDYDTFIALQSQDKRKYYRRAFLMKRYWSAGDGKYLWHTAVEISSDVLDYGFLNQEYDYILGEWRYDSLTITINNVGRKYGTEGSVWTDCVSDYSIIYIENGYVDSDGNQHGINYWSGVIDRDGINEADFDNPTSCMITLLGYDAILDAYSAEDVTGNQITNESLTGSVTTYTTANIGVGIIRKITVNGTRVYAGVDFEESDLNVKTSPATIEFNSTPTHTPVCDYTYWYQDIDFKTLIEHLLNFSDITNRVIQQASFPSGINFTRTVDTDAEWNAGTIDNLEVDSDKLYLNSWVNFGRANSLTSYYNFGASQTQIINQNFTQQFTGTVDTLAIDVTASGFRFWLSVKTTAGVLIQEALYVTSYIAGVNIFTEGKRAGGTTVSFNIPLTASTEYFYEIAQVLPMVSGCSINLAEPITGSKCYQYVWGLGYSEIGYSLSCGLFCGTTGSFMSDTLDTNAVTDYINSYFNATATLSSFITLYTRSQSADSSWPVSFSAGDWEEVIGGVIASTPEDYTRIAISIDVNAMTSPSPLTGNPYQLYLSSLTLKFQSSEFLISLADFTAMSIRDACNSLADMPNYARGFNGNRQYFYRDKVFSGSTDAIITDVKENINYREDHEHIVNRVKVFHGGYTFLVDSVTEGATEPTSIQRNGVSELSLNFGSIVSDPDAESAQGIGQQYWDTYGDTDPKMVFEFVMFPRLDLELGDVLKFYRGIELTDTDKPFNTNMYLTRIGLNLNNGDMEGQAIET